MPCYRCGIRQVDPEPGQPSSFRRGVVDEHQVLICPACQPAAHAHLSRCPGCAGVSLIRRLDQVECLDCRLIRDADPAAEACGASPAAADRAASGLASADLAAEVSQALERMRGTR